MREKFVLKDVNWTKYPTYEKERAPANTPEYKELKLLKVTNISFSSLKVNSKSKFTMSFEVSAGIDLDSIYIEFPKKS